MSNKYNDFDHYMNTGGHLDNIPAALLGGGLPSAPSSPHPHPYSDAQGMAVVRDVLSDILDDHAQEGKVQLMAALLHMLNTPVVLLGGLTPLHWLGLNPLVILGALVGHLGPSPPPPILPSQDPDLHQAISDTVCGAVGDQFRYGLAPLEDLSTEVHKGFEEMSRRFNVVEMAHPPAPAPMVAPVAPPPAPVPVAPVPAPPAPAPVSKPRTKKPSAPLPTPVPAKAQPASAKAKSTPAPTPAPVTHPTPPPASKPSFTSMAKTPAWPSLVVSLCPPVAGATIPQAVRRSPQEIVSHLNAVLLSKGHQVTLSAAWWTVKNNLVVTAGPDTTAHHLASSSHLISDSLATYLSADHSPLPVQARENCKWACLTINGIPTGVSLTWGPYSPPKLTTALLTDNPVCCGLRMTLPPSWVRVPASYTPGSTSSIVLTFEDPSRDSLRSLMAERTLFAFGHAGELKHWKAKPCKMGKGTPAASS
ncbi:hypothetical protein EDB89DRAFT_2073464 [Lactarius sanguifluus]|nr:hypothetical protein EDB89DRAFT_2073464 [Lactarius sanguifluus]